MLHARSFIAFLDRVGFGHVFPLFRGAIETRPFSVVNVCFAVNPYEAVASARRGRIGCRLGSRAFCRR